MVYESTNAAWRIVCRLFKSGNIPFKENMLSSDELKALAFLQKQKVVEAQFLEVDEILCPNCLQWDAYVTFQLGQRFGRCPNCGKVPLKDTDFRTWRLKAHWVESNIARALNLSATKVQEIQSDISLLGVHDNHPVALSRDLFSFVMNQEIIKRVHVKGKLEPLVIAPKPSRHLLPNPYGVGYVPLEDSFIFYGQFLQYIPHSLDDVPRPDEDGPCFGPFSKNFRTIYFDDEARIDLTAAQAAVFKAMWEFHGVPQLGETIMNKANQKSEKPVDVFKVKSQFKDSVLHVRRKESYDRLVQYDNRLGGYWMSCSA